MKKRVLPLVIFLTTLLTASSALSLGNTTQTIATTEDNTINLFFPARVGDEAVFDIDSNGNPTGYFGDLFRKVSQITSINVNFIIETDNDKITSDINKIRNYEGNVSYVGLDNADVEFDAITNVLTDEREEYPDFTFTVNSDCLSPVYLFTQDSNLTISEGETSSYEGKTIGLFSKAKTRNNLFYDFAKNIGLYDRDDIENSKINVVTYDTLEELNLAFIAKRVDVIVDRPYDLDLTSTRTLDCIGTIDFYLGLSKGKEKLYATINTAINYLMVIEPSFVDNLYKTYFPTRYNHIILNESEKQYIASKSVIKVGYCGNMNPYIFEKNDVMDGLIPTYLKTIFDIVADVDIQYYDYDDFAIANNDLKNGVVDIWFATPANNTSTFAIYTNSYLDFDMDFIVNPDSYSKEYDDMNVGIYIFDVGYVKTGKKLNYYYSMEDMLKDVSSGKLDGAFCAYHIYQYATYTLRINNLINKETYDTYGVSFGLNSSSTYLHSILNKGIHYMTYNELDSLEATYLTTYKYTNLFTDWLNYNIAIIIPSLIALFVICMGVIIYIVIVNKDRKKKNKKLTDLVTLDLLTGLYNKDESAKITEEYVNSNTPFSLFIIDLDNFKSINDTYGHEAGDEALVEFGKILKGLTNYRSKAFRFGGDEFIFIVEGATKEGNIELSKQILGKMKTIHISFKIFKPTCSIGVAMFPEGGNTVKELLYNADLALYSVKAAGKNNYEIFDGGRKYPNSIRMEVIEQIKKSIENNDVYMLFQPQIDVKTNKVVGYEALMRIRNFQYGPADFIALAEKSGIIAPLGRIALVQAIEFLGMLKENGFEHVGVSINYSALQINDSGYFDLLVGEANKHHVSLEDVTIEFTESIFFGSTPNVQTFVDEIKKNKIKLDLDDFGSGNSSINNLTKFNFNTIKFDKDLINNKTLFPTISNLIDFVHSIGYKVLAEGVETKEQYDIMKDKHCDLIQGYYFAKPMDKYDAIEYGKKFNNVN